MNKNEETVLEEVKKPTSRTKKTAVASTSENKTKKTATTKKAKPQVAEKPVQDATEKLVKAVKSKEKIHIEYFGKQVSEDDIAERIADKLKENDFKGTIKSVEIYYKVEENTAYCVVNDGEPIVLNF